MRWSGFDSPWLRHSQTHILAGNNLYSMKYTKETLEEAVKTSKSISQVLRKIGLSTSGGNHSHIAKKIRYFEINTSHFTGQGWNRGNISNNRKKANEILVLTPGKRTKGHQLTRAMVESDIPHKCAECDTKPHYNGKPLTLQVDHKNGNWEDNTLENLRFLCPNCHSQTPTFGAKNI